jgi:hypothetical protein
LFARRRQRAAPPSARNGGDNSGFHGISNGPIAQEHRRLATEGLARAQRRSAVHAEIVEGL